MTEALEVSKEMQDIIVKISVVEHQLEQLKKLEEEKRALKDELLQMMTEYNVKSWETPNGTKITAVAAVPPAETVVKKFDEASFMMDEADLYAMYQKEIVKKDKGRKGYVRITLPKENADG